MSTHAHGLTQLVGISPVMDLREILSLAWKRRLTVLAFLGLTLVGSAAFAFTQPERYEATVTIVLQPNFDKVRGFIPSDALTTLLGTYVATVESRQNLADAASRIGHPLPGKVEASTEAGSGVLRVTGKAGDPHDALDTAQAAAGAFIARLARTNEFVVPDLVDRGAAPTDPVQPRPKLILAAAALLGLVGGVLLALARERLRGRIETVEDITVLTDVPVIGRIPPRRVLARNGPRLLWEEPDQGEYRESIRSLRTNLQLVNDGWDGAIQVTSPGPSAGKSTLTANLGVALAALGVRTVIVDADILKPVQHKIFGMPNDWGVNTLLTSPQQVPRPLPTSFENLSLIPAGSVTGSPDRLHVGFASLMRRVKKLKMLVLVDSPPVLQVSDSRLIARNVAHVLLVVAAGREHQKSLSVALETLALADASIAGIVVNAISPEESGYGYGYGYGSRGGEETSIEAPLSEVDGPETPTSEAPVQSRRAGLSQE